MDQSERAKKHFTGLVYANSEYSRLKQPIRAREKHYPLILFLQKISVSLQHLIVCLELITVLEEGFGITETNTHFFIRTSKILAEPHCS